MPDVTVDVHQLLEELRAARSNGRPRHEPLWRIEDSSEVVAALRSVREHGPGRLRAVALDALAFLAGPAALDPADVAAIERLIRIRRRTDPLVAVMSCWTYWWCIRTDDQAAVVASLGLTDARPVTFNLACSSCHAVPWPSGRTGRIAVTTAPITSSLSCPTSPLRTTPAASAAATYRLTVFRSTPAWAATVRNPTPDNQARRTSRTSITETSR